MKNLKLPAHLWAIIRPDGTLDPDWAGDFELYKKRVPRMGLLEIVN